jgi:hypothetical protein
MNGSFWPYLLLIGNCCLGPIFLFSLGLYIGKNGLPVAVVRRGGQRSGIGNRYAE